ncbi:hypothetical protein OCK74_09160 [Chitinophagaceae bacterium LB-8]|uniref:Uncharacterized protein n=1 Tax=Paraflavisolibacter caeni TaxID=2982496 RepID=A0A9X2XNW6_9BACT|nr:hypothetical protein [Paraflavisolibacter caeni]MCU7549284.1 hypothetical protein [Paraflavisolibacter caeni]
MQSKSISFSQSIFINILLAGSLMLLLNSCSRKLNFSSSVVVPAAEGSVKVKKDRNKNYSIKVSAINLAEPEKLLPPKSTYVVWIETERNGIKNIGQLKSSSGFLTKTLKATLNTVTSFKPNRFFITAEDEAKIQYPGGQVVLTTSHY